ncbi:MAG: hypothetical protein EBR33_12315 [Synechococcaceae bacterium WB4_1_0192]|nr:hypothetical protein [Synechococcaceae bacterium WB4_1_0192]
MDWFRRCPSGWTRPPASAAAARSPRPTAPAAAPACRPQSPPAPPERPAAGRSASRIPSTRASCWPS